MNANNYVEDETINNSLFFHLDNSLIEELSSDSQLQTYPRKNNLLNIFGIKKQNKKERYKNSDNFYRDIYEYFYRKGMFNIIISNICDIFLICIGVSFLFFLLECLDWENLLLCTNNKNCGDIFLFTRKPTNPKLVSFVFLFFGIMFILHKIIDFYSTFRQISFIEKYYETKLQISNRELQTVKWSVIIKKLEEQFRMSSYDITNKILKNENYYISIIHNSVLNIPNIIFYTNQLEFNIKMAIFNDLENIDADNLKKRFYLLGILNLVFSPIIFIYLLLYFIVCNIEEVYSKSNVISSRNFLLLTKWKIRQYNEMKHFFEKRVNKAIPLSNFYLKQFPSPIFEILGKTLAITCGIFFSFNLFLSIFDENILLHVTIFDRSLLFYTGVMGAISSFSRSLIRKPEDSIYNPTKYMNDFFQCTKYIPVHWKDKFHTHDVRDEFIKLFPYKLLLLLYDLVSVITTPFILILYLTKDSNEIFNFIKNNTMKIKKVGNVCTYAYLQNFNENAMNNSIILYKENNEIENNNTYYDDDDDEIKNKEDEEDFLSD